jgi:glycine/D-amino acid oxidase-like deaminating enzyme
MSEYTQTLPPLRWDEPRTAYDVVIVGGGGHGLSTAYYLATRHGITNVAVIEADYIASGNTGRNTTIIRANYGVPEAIRFYQHSLELYAGLEEETGARILHQEKGLIWLAHTEMAMRTERARCLLNTACGAETVATRCSAARITCAVRPLGTTASRGRSRPGRWTAGSTSSSTPW